MSQSNYCLSQSFRKMKLPGENVVVFKSEKFMCPNFLSELKNSRKDDSLNGNFNGRVYINPKHSIFKKSKSLFPRKSNMGLPIIQEHALNTQNDDISHYDVNLFKKKINKLPSMQEPSTSANSSKKWKKLSNIIRSVSLLNQYHAKTLISDIDIENDIHQFKERKLSLRSSNMPKYDPLDDSAGRELLRLSLKERFLNVILEGEADSVKTLDELFERNPDKFSRDNSDAKFIFNTPMTNGQTLMYIAAREGKHVIITYMIGKNLNAKIKSNLDGIEETCLQVACRWGCMKVVEILLEKVPYEKVDIEEVLKYQNLSNIITRMLERYYNAKFKRKEEGVLCFC